MSDTDGQRGRTASTAAGMPWLLFWFLRNVVVFVFLAYPGAIALIMLVHESVEYSYSPSVSIVEAVIQGTSLVWGLTLPSALPLAVAFSAIVVGLSLVLSGKWLRLAATASLVPVAAWVVLYAFVPQTGWSLPGVAQLCAFSVCAAAYGWFCAVPPLAVGARARWEAVVANGALVVSLAVPTAIVLLLVVPIAFTSLSY